MRNEHKCTIVPIECWAYASPELATHVNAIDLGIFCKSLLFYDSIYFTLSNPNQFAELIKWLTTEKALDHFEELLKNGTIKFIDYAFSSAPIIRDGVYSMINIQDQLQFKPNSFEERYFFNSREVRHSFQSIKILKKFRRIILDHVLEEKAVDYSPVIESSRLDICTVERAEIIYQSLIDELFKMRKLTNIPDVKLSIIESNGQWIINSNVNIEEIGKSFIFDSKISNGTFLAGSLTSNKLIHSAIKYKCDLFLPSPLDTVVGDKLFESERILKASSILTNLEETIEFPDIRSLVNNKLLSFKEIINLRKKAVLFRKWLQTESERNRETLYAYQNDVFNSPLYNMLLKTPLKLFGVFGGATIGALLSSDNKLGPLYGALIGTSVTSISDLVANMMGDWRPIVFGNWFEKRIKKYLDKRLNF